MSRKGSKRNRDNKKNKHNAENDDRYTRQGNGTNNGNEELSAVTFKYPGRFATLTRTILLNENLTIKELQRKITLTPSQQPPDAKSIFISYYMDEIFPFINKHAQETINTKKSIEKSWDLQTNHFQKIYIKRGEMLRQKWNEMRNGKSSSSHSHHSNGHHSTNNGASSHSSHSHSHSNGSYTVTNHHHHYNKYSNDDNRKGNDDESGEGISDSTTVIFKYYSVHSSAKTNRHIFIKSPTKKELLNKIKLSINSNPPNAKELFEIYYYDEILPFLKKSGQQSIRGKKDLSKVWQIQTKTFKNLYEERAKILMEEWLKMKKENKKSKKSRNSNDHHKDSMDEKKKSSLKTPKNGHKNNKMSFPSSTNDKIKNNKNKINGESHLKIEKIECSLIRTLLNFLLFVEGTTKENCFMLLINDQNERHSEYNKFESYLKKINIDDVNVNVNVNNDDKQDKDDKDKQDKQDLVYFHLRVYVDNFDESHLRLHTGKQLIKLCFVNDFEEKKQIKEKEEELILFELRFNKLIAGLEEKIDHEHIEANLDEETRILSINVPLF